MRNMLLAIAGLAAITFSSTVYGQDANAIAQDVVEAAAPLAPSPLVDSKPAMSGESHAMHDSHAMPADSHVMQGDSHQMMEAQPLPQPYIEQQPVDHMGHGMVQSAPIVSSPIIAQAAAPCGCCQNHGVVVVKKKKNVFAKLMDLERRKNAWLKRTFFGK